MSRQPWDQALLDALSAPPDRTMTIDEVAASTGISSPLLEVLVREGLLVPGSAGRFDADDVEAVRAGLALLQGGVPLAELLELGRRVSEALRPVAEGAVDLFARYVRDSVEGAATSPAQAADAMVGALRAMLPAAGRLVASHFAALLQLEARRRLDAPDLLR